MPQEYLLLPLSVRSTSSCLEFVEAVKIKFSASSPIVENSVHHSIRLPSAISLCGVRPNACILPNYAWLNSGDERSSKTQTSCTVRRDYSTESFLANQHCRQIFGGRSTREELVPSYFVLCGMQAQLFSHLVDMDLGASADPLTPRGDHYKLIFELFGPSDKIYTKDNRSSAQI